MPTLDAERYRYATAGGLLFATAALGLGIERLASGAQLIGFSLTALGVAGAAIVLSLKIEGDPSRGTVLLLTREACPHCDEARGILRHLQDELGFDLWEVDITEDPELVQAYGDEVPVVVHEQRKVATLEVREAKMRDVLAPSTG